MPSTLITIAKKAFYDCANLYKVIIEEGLTSIGDEAFSDCTGLYNISLPKSLTSIGVNAFYECYNLKEVFISKSVTYIGSNAFYGCTRVFIYCEAESKPESWNDYWNENGGPVFWYRETNPGIGTYWHYVDGKIVIWSSFS